MITHKQLSLAEIFEDCQNKLDNDKPAFLSLLETHIDLDEMIPITFRNHFYASTGRARKYSLKSLLWALIIQRIFSIPTDQLLLTFLTYSKPLREFCGFSKVPDASKITRFKQDFLAELQLVFDNLVDLSEPICQAIDSAKADMTIFDSSGIEALLPKIILNMPTALSNSLKLMQKLTTLLNLMTLIKQHMALCLHTLLLILQLNSSISMGIFVMSLNSVLSLTVLESSVIFLFTTRIS